MNKDFFFNITLKTFLKLICENTECINWVDI